MHQLEVLEVLLGDEADGDVEDVQLVALDQVQQQVEGALELRELHPVLRRGGGGLHGQTTRRTKKSVITRAGISR